MNSTTSPFYDLREVCFVVFIDVKLIVCLGNWFYVIFNLKIWILRHFWPTKTDFYIIFDQQKLIFTSFSTWKFEFYIIFWKTTSIPVAQKQPDSVGHRRKHQRHIRLYHDASTERQFYYNTDQRRGCDESLHGFLQLYLFGCK